MQKKVIAEQEVEVYQYGFEILISTTLGLLITVAIGIVLNMFFLELVFIAKKWYNRRYEKRISSNKLRK